MSEPVLLFDGVTRRFGRTVALDRVDLRIPPGAVVGLVGRNGAGKTTALRLVTGVLHADGGSIRVLGLDPRAQGRQVRTRVSLLAEESSLYPWMTVGEIVGFAAGLHPRWDSSYAEQVRARLDLDPSRRIAALSRGTRAKVALLLAVAPRPDVLLLDDPTSGLDPLVRREIVEALIEAVPESGGAVVYASHLLHDLERVVDRVVVLDGGRVVLDEDAERIRSGMRRYVAVFEGGAPDVPLEGAVDVRREGRVLTVVSNDPDGRTSSSLRALGASAVEEQSMPLEDLLVAYLRQGGRA